MKLSEKKSKSPEKSIVNLQHGRPLLLGNDIDEKVKEYVINLRYKGGKAIFLTEIAVAKALIKQGGSKSLKVLKFGKGWAQSSFKRMGFKNSAESAELIYLYDIVTKI